jgi:hypothetical protein
VIVAVVLIAGGSRFLGAKATALLKFGAGSSVAQRYGYWSAALRLAGHNTLVGTGPDTFAVTYTRYQDAALAKTLGSTYFVNGVHNIFLSWLANEGVPGLLLIVALLVFAVAWGVRAWRSLAGATPAPEVDGDLGPAPDEVRRFLVVALVAALAAYFVQASFDVEQVATLFTLFVVLGLLGTATRGIWPVATLLRSPFRVRPLHPDQDSAVAELDADYPSSSAPVGAYGRSASRARSDLRRLGGVVVVAAVGLTAVGLSFWRTDALWRADHQERVSTQSSLERATTLNPWEPSYFETLGRSAATTYLHDPKASDAPAIMRDAVGFFGHEAALDGDNTNAQTSYGSALATLGSLEHSDKAVLRQALAAFTRARQDDPFNTKVTPLITRVQTSLRRD